MDKIRFDNLQKEMKQSFTLKAQDINIEQEDRCKNQIAKELGKGD